MVGSFPVAVTKHLASSSLGKPGWAHLVSQLDRIQSSMARTAWRLELVMTGHIASSQEAQSSEVCFSTHILVLSVGPKPVE